MALKTLHSAMAQEKGGVERFKREISILSKIRHPAVPKVFGWGTHTAELYFAGEFIGGNDLKKEIKEKGPMAPGEAAKLIADVADALTLTHAMDIVHRDIKPNNIMLTPERTVKLLDFGIARRMGQAMETITKTGMIVGTPEYMSPEQFGTHRVDERSDIYSLGVVLYELLTGQTPFSGSSPIVIALKVITEPPPAPRSIRKEIPAWLDRVVMKCMDKDPKKRFTSAAELFVELRKPRVGGKARMKWLSTGDAIVEDESEDSPWALVLSSSKEKTGWTIEMGFRFSDALYMLKEIVPPSGKQHRWNYNFIFWPPESVFRRLVDYEKEAAEEAAAPVKESFLSKAKKVLFGAKS